MGESMITKLRYYENFRENTVPFRNLAIEEYLLEQVQPGECILYLWQNRHTVVIGRNQNPWAECKLNALQESGGYLARRLSGGGAVYHDLGNLNFTFLVGKADYDLDRQLCVILDAVRQFGIEAKQSGRNDLEIDGQKFSGNAFYDTRGRCYHHGTLLVNVDMEKLGAYLQVSKAKLASKGVQSVHSRVVNLCQLAPEITIPKLARQLIESFQKIYGLPAQAIHSWELPEEKLGKKEGFFASDAWRLGTKLPFTAQLEQRYPWGNLQLQFVVTRGMITQAAVYSDGMDGQFLSGLAKYFIGCYYEKATLLEQLETVPSQTQEQEQILVSLRQLLQTDLE